MKRTFLEPELSTDVGENADVVLDLLGGTVRAKQRLSQDAIDALTRKAASGDAESQYNLARLFYLTKDKAGDAKAAAKWLKKAVMRDHVASLHLLACLYLEGKGIAQDTATGLELMRKAAILGNADAQFDLGVLLAAGTKDIPASAEEAIRWFRLAAAQGHTRAQYRLGKAFLDGTGVAQSYASALTWLKTAAIEGYAPAQYEYGRFFLDKENPKFSLPDAFRWMRLAAKDGDANAQEALAALYETGSGCVKDEVKAFFWATEAAKQDNIAAGFRLARYYQEGIGTKPDALSAYTLLSFLAQKETIDAKDFDACVALLSQEERAVAQKRLAAAQKLADLLT